MLYFKYIAFAVCTIVILFIICNLIIRAIISAQEAKENAKKWENQCEVLKNRITLEYEGQLKELYKVVEITSNEVNDLNTQKKKLQTELAATQKIYDNMKNNITENINDLKKEKERQILLELENLRQKKIYELEYDFQIKSQELNSKLSSQEKENEDKIIKLTKEIKEIQILLDDYKKKQESINQNILREKALRDRETFYKIEVSEKDRSDIKGLVNLAYDFNRREVIYKLIYDCFLKKPTLEMCKRVLDGGRPSGIYRITYLETGESYIGKSTDVYKRWQEHIKTSLNIGSIAHTTFHDNLNKLGWWNFTFELLEEVPKDKLNEREKFYIETYQTDKFGFNMKAGG